MTTTVEPPDRLHQHLWVIHLYQQGYTSQEVARFSGLHRSSVMLILRRHGVTIRTRGNRLREIRHMIPPPD